MSGGPGPAHRPESGDTSEFSAAWRSWRRRVDLTEYDARWARLEAEGHSVHDEAVFVDGLAGPMVLDAGCGTGRVAVELSRRGRVVVGVDNDPDMLAYAARKPEPVRWVRSDLAALDLPERFDIALLAGNILLFVRPDSRPAVIEALVRHLRLGGLLVNGSSAGPGCRFEDVDRWFDQAGLELQEQYATWDRAPFDGGDYRVSIHRLAS